MDESWHSVHSVNEPLDNERGKSRKTTSDHRIRAGPNQQTRIEDKVHKRDTTRTDLCRIALSDRRTNDEEMNWSAEAETPGMHSA
jgi:hypothetical protein